MDFRVLGPLEIEGSDGPIEIRSRRQRAILAVLLLHAGSVVSTDRLIDEIWGEEPPETAGHALEVHVSALRAAIGRDAIETRLPGYRLSPGFGPVDLRHFELLVGSGLEAAEAGDAERARHLLREALDLWRGDALEDLSADGVAQPERARLDVLREVVLERWLDAELAAGRHVDVLPELERAAREHPLREGIHERLIVALYRSGRQAEALDAFRAARKILAEQVGLEPGPALAALEGAVLRQDPALEPSAVHAAGAAGAPERPGPIDARSFREMLVTTAPGTPIESAAIVARTLAPGRARGLILAALTPEDALLLSVAADELRRWRGHLADHGIAARIAAHTTSDWAADIAGLASRTDVDMVVVAMPSGARKLDAATARLLRLAECDVALVHGPLREVVAGPAVVPFGGSSNDWAALELAAWLAAARGIDVWLVGVRRGDVQPRPERSRGDASRLLADASLLLQRAVGVDARPRLVDDGVDGLLDVARQASLVVAGLSERWQAEGLGPVRSRLVAESRTPVVLTRRGIRPGALAPTAALTRYTWSIADGLS